MVAIVRRSPHWKASKDEVAEFSDDLAAALSMIPASYADKALQASTVGAAVAGLGGMVGKRVAVDAAHKVIKQQQDDIKQAAQQEAEQTHQRPEPETPAPNGSEPTRAARGTIPGVGEGWS